MARRRAGAGLALAAIALSAAGCGIGGTTTTTVTATVTRTVTTTRAVTTVPAQTPDCTASQLSGTFALVPGSQGAGHVAYRLKLTNISHASCNFQGPLEVVLLSATGSALPTYVVPSQTVSFGLLDPGGRITAQARFSPDVPGTGDSQSGACQPKAYTLRVTANGGGTVDAPIKPPTSVCEQGTLAFDPLH